MGSDISIPEAVSRVEARALAEHRQKEEEARGKEWEKHATLLERKICAEYINLFNKAMIRDPRGIQEVPLFVYKDKPTAMELACLSSAVEKKGYKIKSEQTNGTYFILITDKT